MRSKKIIDSDEVPLLPQFPSAPYDVVVTFYDGSIEVIKVMARGKVAAIETACYTMAKWPDNKIPNIAAVSFNEIIRPVLAVDSKVDSENVATVTES